MVSTRSKVSSAEEAVLSIEPESELTVGGFAHTLVPLALIRALINSGRGPFDLAALGEAWAAELLAAAGLLRRVRLSNFMFEGWGRCRSFSRAVEQGTVAVKDFSHLAMAIGYLAGGWNLDSISIRSLSGSDMAPEVPRNRRYTVRPIRPDVALIHVHQADERGNAQIYGPLGAAPQQAIAAKRVIVSAERIVSEREIAKRPQSTVIPGFLVSHVVEAPFGAHPTGMYGVYDTDFEHVDSYIRSSRDERSVRLYIERYVVGKVHRDYLTQVGIRRLLTLRAEPGFGYSPALRRRFFRGAPAL